MTVSFLDAKEGQCRFPPISEEPGPAMLFCGEPTEDGSSFCPACQKVVYAPQPRALPRFIDNSVRVGSGDRDSTPNLCEVFS